MSWEVIKTIKIECLCGNGTIEQELLEDDWNNIDETIPVIKCDECSKKYKIESKNFAPKPAHEYTRYYCVNKEDETEVIELNI